MAKSIRCIQIGTGPHRGWYSSVIPEVPPVEDWAFFKNGKVQNANAWGPFESEWLAKRYFLDMLEQVDIITARFGK